MYVGLTRTNKPISIHLRDNIIPSPSSSTPERLDIEIVSVLNLKSRLDYKCDKARR